MSYPVATLTAKLADAKAKGHEWVQLVKYTRSSPRNWTRCRVISGRPSLMGRCVGEIDAGKRLFDVRVGDLEKWLEAKGGFDAAIMDGTTNLRTRMQIVRCSAEPACDLLAITLRFRPW